MHLVTACDPSGSVASHSDFDTGATRDEIQSDFGQPKSIIHIRKQDNSIWGAIESFWASVPNGATVEIWSYQSENPNEVTGHTELYFVDGSDTVDGIAFSPDGVVYESN